MGCAYFRTPILLSGKNMKINKYLSVIVPGLLFAALIAGIIIYRSVSGPATLNRYTATFLDVFDTRTEIVGFAKSKDEFAKDAQLIKDELIRYNKLYDIYNDYPGVNNIKTINDNAGVKPVKVDPDIISLIEFSIDTYYETDGAVNIALGSVLSLWHKERMIGMDDPDRAKLPDEDELKKAALHTDITNIVIDRENSTVFLSDPDMSLDVGSTGKGYAMQRVLEYAREKELNNILLSLGGNISCVHKEMKKNDMVLISIILVAAIACLLGMRIWQKNNTKGDAAAVVTIDGNVYGEYPLSEDYEERIELPDGSYNVLTIKDGFAQVSEASCPDQICVHHNHIKYSGESIVCLPNKLVVTVKGGEDNGIDGSTY